MNYRENPEHELAAIIVVSVGILTIIGFFLTLVVWAFISLVI